MKIEILFTKNEFEIAQQFAKKLGHEFIVMEYWGEDNVRCEIELGGKSAHLLFHAGIDYCMKRLEQSKTK